MANNPNKGTGAKAPRYTVFLFVLAVINGTARTRVLVLDPKGQHAPAIPILLYLNGKPFPGDFKTGRKNQPGETEGIFEIDIPLPPNAPDAKLLAVAAVDGKPNSGDQTITTAAAVASAKQKPAGDGIEIIFHETKLPDGEYLYMAVINCATGHGMAENMTGIPNAEVMVDGVPHSSDFPISLPEKGRTIHLRNAKRHRVEVKWIPERWPGKHRVTHIPGTRPIIDATRSSNWLVGLFDGCQP